MHRDKNAISAFVVLRSFPLVNLNHAVLIIKKEASVCGRGFGMFYPKYALDFLFQRKIPAK